MKEEKNIKEKKKVLTKENKKLENRTKYIVFVAVVVVLSVGIIFGINRMMLAGEQKKYEGYEAKMNQYGLNQLYQNGSAKTSEYITKSEAVKVILGATLNMNDISGISSEPSDSYDNARWVLYAQDKDVISESDITSKNEKAKVTYIAVLEEIAAAKEKVLNQSLDKTQNVNITNYDKFTITQKEAIADLIQNGILTNDKKSFNGNKKVYKGMLNELMVKYVEKYNLLAIETEELETDSSKFPSNASVYPYMIKGIDKSVYEMPFVMRNKDNFQNPAQLYTSKKWIYNQIVDNNNQYFNALLNIDYRTITEENFIERFDGYTTYRLDTDEVKAYVAYVKANQIIITGKATTQNPIIYKDDAKYRARTKIEFEVKSSNTSTNLLFKDSAEGNVKYANKKYDMYVDTYMGQLMLSDTIATDDISIYQMLIQKDNSITLEEGGQP